MVTWTALGVGTQGAAGDGGAYRVTALESTLGRPGLRYVAELPLEPSRGYRAAIDVAYSEGARGRKRLTAYWLQEGYGAGGYGDGPYGGGVPFAYEVGLPMPGIGETAHYEVAGIVPEEGAVGVALLITDDGLTTPWAAGEWMEASGAEVTVQPFALEPVPTMQPVPRVRILFTDMDQRADHLTVYAIEGGNRRPVRGAWKVTTSSLVTFDDYLAPFGRDLTYLVQLYDAAGGELDALTATCAPLAFRGTIVQHIIDPRRAAQVRLLEGAEESLTWRNDGTLERPGGSVRPVFVGSGRWPLQGIPLRVATDTEEQELALRDALGIDLPDSQDHLPMVAVRTSHRVRFPQPLQAVITEPSAQGLDWLAGGFTTHWSLPASEARPPGPALVRPGTTWDDVAAIYDTWGTLAAAYPTWADLITDDSLRGAADA